MAADFDRILTQLNAARNYLFNIQLSILTMINED